MDINYTKKDSNRYIIRMNMVAMVWLLTISMIALTSFGISTSELSVFVTAFFGWVGVHLWHDYSTSPTQYLDNIK